MFHARRNLFNLAFGDKLNPFYHLGTISFWQFWLLVGTGFYLIFADTGVHWRLRPLGRSRIDQWWAGGIMRSIHRYATDGMILTMILHLIRHFALRPLPRLPRLLVDHRGRPAHPRSP